MVIHESAENYLETILILQKRNGQVRSIDIANELNYSKPSISNAMKNFRELGYITMDNHGYISLTESGQILAERVYNRHILLKNYLIALGISKATAEEDACRIEHVISEESFVKIMEDYNKKNNSI